MSSAIRYSACQSLRLVLLALLFAAPVGAFAFSGASTTSFDKQGAGFVLYVTLQRNAMN